MQGEKRVEFGAENIEIKFDDFITGLKGESQEAAIK